MMKRLSGRWPVAVFLTLTTCLVSVSGCQKGAQGSATVSGRVLYNKDVPVEYGIVVFHNDAGRIGRSIIQKDGVYSIANLPEGEVKICVRAKTLEFKEMRIRRRQGEKVEKPAPTEMSQLMDKLTAKYGAVEKTPLMFTVQGSEQKHDIVLSLP